MVAAPRCSALCESLPAEMISAVKALEDPATCWCCERSSIDKASCSWCGVWLEDDRSIDGLALPNGFRRRVRGLESARSQPRRVPVAEVWPWSQPAPVRVVEPHLADVRPRDDQTGENAATALPDDQSSRHRVAGVTCPSWTWPRAAVRERRGQETELSALLSEVGQSLLTVYFLREAQESIVWARSSIGDVREKATVGLREPDTVLPLEGSDRVFLQGRPKSVFMV